MTIDLGDTPYSIEETGLGVILDAASLMERVELLRAQGALSEATLNEYFGEKRFEQIAESNALEGSPLTVGETQLAVLRGVTITGHDPAFSKDAIALGKALERITELARETRPTDIEQVQELHGMILEGRPGAGRFRNEAVIISGSAHRPPKTWAEVMSAMECWEEWSRSNPSVSPILRGIVLHTWFTHVHPYVDGNGRTARALLNLELIRGGVPSIIIRRKDRERYLDALAESDLGGDLGPIAELVLARAGDALRDLERAAGRHQGYTEVSARLRQRQKDQLSIWNDAVKLLLSLLSAAAGSSFGEVGSLDTRWYDDQLSLEDFIALSQGRSEGNSWLFRIGVKVPAVGAATYLAWTGFRSDEMRAQAHLEAGPSVFWSIPDPTGNRPWVSAHGRSPGGVELTLELPDVDKWVVRSADGSVERLASSALVDRIVRDIESDLG